MKLRNLILLPIAGLTTAVPTLTLASCNKDPQPQPEPEPVVPDFGGFKSVTLSDGHQYMESIKAVDLSANIEYSCNIVCKIVEEEQRENLLVFVLYDENLGIDDSGVVLKDFANILCFVDGEETKLAVDEDENFPYFVKANGDPYSYSELLNKKISFKFKLKNNISNAKILSGLAG